MNDKYNIIIDPFEEEDWNEIDYHTINKFGYFYDDELEKIIVELYNKERKDKYYSYIHNIKPDTTEMSHKISRDINTKLYNTINHISYYNRIKSSYKIIKNIIGFTIINDTFSRYCINPFKNLIEINMNPFGGGDMITNRRYKKLVIPQNNKLKIFYNIFNYKKKIKIITNDFYKIIEDNKNSFENELTILNKIIKYKVIFNGL